MAAAIEGAGFWLPSEFLTNGEILMDKQSLNKSDNNDLDSDFCFPSEFPYHFEPHPDHLLQSVRAMSTSPQSTLPNSGSVEGSKNGSPNCSRSPLTMPMTSQSQYDAVGNLICLAAGEVAKLKLNHGYGVNSYPPPSNLAQFTLATKIPTPSIHLSTKFENNTTWSVRGVNHVAWPPHHIPTPGRAPYTGGGTAAKKMCSGTGVFLPRRYENKSISYRNCNSSIPPRKPGCSASPLQGRASAVESQPQLLQPRIFISIGSQFDVQSKARSGASAAAELCSFAAAGGIVEPSLPPAGVDLLMDG